MDVTDTAAERRAADLVEFARGARPQPVADAATAVLLALAEVEGHLHGVAPEAVHLHELGGHDTVVDVVGVCAALHDLGVDRLHAGPLPMGHGVVQTRHGLLPVPAPATAALLAGAVVVGSDLPGETVTPTAAALLASLDVHWDAPPPFIAGRTGYGAGTRQLDDRPNVAVIRLGVEVSGPPAAAGPTGAEALVELATTVDDVTGETLGYLMDRLLAAGALDVWITPAVMKKSRPGHVVQVLSRRADAVALRDIVLRETGTLGIRSWPVDRYALPRDVATVRVDGQPIRVKRGPYGRKPEFEDVAAAARVLERPLRDVAYHATKEATDGESR